MMFFCGVHGLFLLIEGRLIYWFYSNDVEKTLFHYDEKWTSQKL